MKTRIITGVLMALLAVILTLFAPTCVFAAVSLLIMVIAWSEWHSLVAAIRAEDTMTYPQAYLQRWLIGALAFVLLGLLCFIFPLLTIVLMALAAIYWGGQVVHLLKTRRFQRWFNGYYDYLGCFLLVGAWIALVYLHAINEKGPVMALGAMLVVWVADSAAYFCGRQFGKKPLAPQISPKKTFEGVYGGMIFAAVVSFLYALYLFDGLSVKVLVWVIASVVAAIVSVVGDLFESYLKRQANVKDSSNLLPGHGGVLDRLDGMLAAMPVFLMIWLILT